MEILLSYANPIAKQNVDHTSTSKVRKVVLCKIGVGRSYVKDEKTAVKDVLPEGYDSFYLTDSFRSVEEEKEYHHEYFLKNASQVSFSLSIGIILQISYVFSTDPSFIHHSL